MKKFLASTLFLSASFSSAQVVEKNHTVYCSETKKVFETLAEKFDETPVLAGSHNGGIVIIWHSKEQNAMSITWTNPAGKETCLVMDGYDVKVIDSKVKKGV